MTSSFTFSNINKQKRTSPLTTLTLFGYSGKEKIWACAQMAFARPKLRQIHGLRFWKLLGSGYGHGFSLRPNWLRYGLLAVWENAEAAGKFFETSSLIQTYRRHADEMWTVWLRPTEAHGAWRSAVHPPSLWRSVDDMQAFAYRTLEHREAMRRTRAEKGSIVESTIVMAIRHDQSNQNQRLQ